MIFRRSLNIQSVAAIRYNILFGIWRTLNTYIRLEDFSILCVLLSATTDNLCVVGCRKKSTYAVLGFSKMVRNRCWSNEINRLWNRESEAEMKEKANEIVFPHVFDYINNQTDCLDCVYMYMFMFIFCTIDFMCQSNNFPSPFSLVLVNELVFMMNR